MGGLLDERVVLETIFNNYDTDGKGSLSPIQIQILHGDLRMGGISLPQVMESMKYVCVHRSNCEPSELYALLQEMDRRFFLIQDFRWEFSMIDVQHKDTISQEEARWFVQTVHGRHFSKRKWEEFVRSRPIPGSSVAFAEIEVMLCNIPNRMDLQTDKMEEEHEREDRLRRERLAEEEVARLKKKREEERRRLEEEQKRGEDLRRKRQLEDEVLHDRQKEKQRQDEEERRRREEEEELERLRELEKKQREEEERRRKEEEELYKDVEKLAKDAEEKEKKTKEELDDLKKKGGSEEEAKRLRKKLQDERHKKLRYNLKVAIKSRDRYQLDYNITEFKKEKLEDTDMDLAKAEKILKELIVRDDLKRAMTKRELEELEKAINAVKKHGLEVPLAKELGEANKLLTRLRRLERIRHEILELKQATVAEIRSYQNPPPVVHKVMTATFLLLGHAEKDTKVWKSVQALVGKTGKESLKRRCIECKPENIPLAPAKRAKALLGGFDLEEVRDVSAGAATFYVWASAMIEELEDLTAQKEEAKKKDV
ncbi:golgin subfamily A member 6-like protein 22 isoform X2 [Ostrea edulis]|uniref:golgin subfamily A member 6-like protein 22 isoform X2 n=1 Tax=Ostrea edulis TaxID=37623 RepID=UPI0024AFEB0A|nr:golgin subfamily A member 6-like protein 22 isoform X2 [Ostrea edulis]